MRGLDPFNIGRQSIEGAASERDRLAKFEKLVTDLQRSRRLIPPGRFRCEEGESSIAIGRTEIEAGALYLERSDSTYLRPEATRRQAGNPHFSSYSGL